VTQRDDGMTEKTARKTKPKAAAAAAAPPPAKASAAAKPSKVLAKAEKTAVKESAKPAAKAPAKVAAPSKAKAVKAAAAPAPVADAPAAKITAPVKSAAKPVAKPRSAAKAKVAAKPAPRPAPKPKTQPKAATPPPQPSAKAADAGPSPGRPGGARKATDYSKLLMSPDIRQSIERLSANLARAALSAQGVMAEAALRQADRPAALTNDPFNAAPAIKEVMGRLAAQPDRLLRAQADLFARYMDLWQSTGRRLASGAEVTPVVTPAVGDRRFTDSEWDTNPVFDVIKQSYLLSSNWLNDLVAGVEDVEPVTKRRAEFFMKMLTDAFSPSNFLISNPAALREALETHGESLVRGMENFAADLERGGGSLQISQTDLTQFEVGRNVAIAPGKVVFQNDVIQLLQFNPSTPQVHEVPLLIFPPWINKYYLLDLRPENSMIRWLTDQGFSVFVVSWVNPDAKLAEKTFDNYMMEGAYEAINQTLKQSGAKTLNAVGYCIAGTMLSCTLAHMAAKGDKRVASATFFAAQQDFSEAGDLKLFTDEDWLRLIEVRMDDAGGVLPGRVMSDTFNALRANDLIWSFFINNYLLGKEPRPFDLLFWNADQTRMPKALHIFYLRRFYQENALAKGDLTLGGERLDLNKVTIPIYVQAGKEDHISPYQSVYRGTHLFGGPVTYVLAGSGHIAGVINPPVANKYQYWLNSHMPASAEGWLADAEETPGSWWPHWAGWLKQRAGGKVAARDPTKGPLKPLEDAPGSFVRVKS
jgi:polyhydroxyalkanoate synthase